MYLPDNITGHDYIGWSIVQCKHWLLSPSEILETCYMREQQLFWLHVTCWFRPYVDRDVCSSKFTFSNKNNSFEALNIECSSFMPRRVSAISRLSPETADDIRTEQLSGVAYQRPKRAALRAETMIFSYKCMFSRIIKRARRPDLLSVSAPLDNVWFVSPSKQRIAVWFDDQIHGRELTEQPAHYIFKFGERNRAILEMRLKRIISYSFLEILIICFHYFLQLYLKWRHGETPPPP